MKHSEYYKIKWHDTNANREVRPSKMLMYMQETANAHLLVNGLSLDGLRDEKGLAFILSRISMRFYHPLYTGDEIEVQTWICEGRGFSFDRCFVILRGGEVIAEAYSIWALLNLKEKRLMRTSEFSYGFPPDLPLESELITRVRMPSASSMESVGQRKIVYSDIDYNGHMNNTKYPYYLKKRILGPNGHLANADCASAIKDLAENGCKRIVLSHISRENNEPEFAMNFIRNILAEIGLNDGSDVILDYNTTIPRKIFKI